MSRPATTTNDEEISDSSLAQALRGNCNAAQARKRSRRQPGKTGTSTMEKESESDGCDFGWALRKAKTGLLVRRKSWNNKDASVRVAPFLVKDDNRDQLVAWAPTESDALAEDWELAND